MELTREYEAAMYRFVYNCFSMCIYALLFGAIIYIGDFGLTTDKHFALSLILGFFAGLLNDIGRKIEFFNRDMLEERKKADQVETAMEDLGKKIKAFSEMHKGKSSDDILAEMRGEKTQRDDKPTTIKGINGNNEEIPNSAWSEEDEKIYNRIYDLIHAAAYANYDVDEDGKELGEYAKITSWFKHLKERVGYEADCTTTKEWSVEDYNEIETIACHLDNIGNEGMAKVLRNIRDKTIEL